MLIDAGVVIGEDGDKGALIEDDVGEGEIVVVRGDDTDTRNEVGLAGSGGLSVFDGKSVDSVVVPGVSVGGIGGGMKVFEGKYVVIIVTIDTPGV